MFASLIATRRPSSANTIERETPRSIALISCCFSYLWLKAKKNFSSSSGNGTLRIILSHLLKFKYVHFHQIVYWDRASAFIGIGGSACFRFLLFLPPVCVKMARGATLLGEGRARGGIGLFAVLFCVAWSAAHSREAM